MFPPSLHATPSTIDPEKAYSWSPNIGWVNWLPSPEHGAVVGEFVCSGYLWSPSIGWIHLGNGEPATGIYYANDSGTDYGVNHDGTGALRGLAWSPNIGWVVFHDHGDPRVNLATGEMLGRAWMPNAGWLCLGPSEDADRGVATRSIFPGKDSDGDGVPDAWKLRHAGDLESVRATDVAANGMSYLDNYLAGLDPFDPRARFQIVDMTVIGDESGTSYELEWTSVPTRFYQIWFSDDLAIWTPVDSPVVPTSDSPTTRWSASVAGGRPARAVFRVEALRPLMDTVPGTQ